MKLRKWLIRAVVVLLILIVAGMAGVAIYFANPYPASAEALAAMQSGNGITVIDKGDYIAFLPDGVVPKVGFIFYPGARVAPAAYAARMSAIAQQGYATFILKLPLNMALLGTEQASKVINDNANIKLWAVGGHSLGGVAASIFANSHFGNNGPVKALILYASYPASKIDTMTIPVTSITGTNDGLATPATIEANKALLPASTVYVPIQGSIHAYFGDYGAQQGDGTPSISREEAAAKIVAATVEALSRITQ